MPKKGQKILPWLRLQQTGNRKTLSIKMELLWARSVRAIKVKRTGPWPAPTRHCIGSCRLGPIVEHAVLGPSPMYDGPCRAWAAQFVLIGSHYGPKICKNSPGTRPVMPGRHNPTDTKFVSCPGRLTSLSKFHGSYGGRVCSNSARMRENLCPCLCGVLCLFKGSLEPT